MIGRPGSFALPGLALLLGLVLGPMMDKKGYSQLRDVRARQAAAA